MFGIPTFDLLSDSGKQGFIEYIVNLVRKEINTYSPQFTNTIINSSHGLEHLIGIASERPAASTVNIGTYWTSTDAGGGTTYRSDGVNWVQIAGAVQGGVAGYYGSFYHNADQPLVAANTEQIIAINSTYGSNGISVSSNQIVIDNPGTYQLTYVLQLTNAANSTQDAFFWLRFNGANYPHSSTQVTMPPRKSSGDPSAQLVTICLTGNSSSPGDYVELYWWGDSTDLSLTEMPALSTPVVTPETPSVIVSVIQVMNTQAGPTGPTGPAGTAATINIGTTTTGTAGTNASVVNSGNTTAAVFDFTIPGSPTINVGTTSTSTAGSSASVTSSGTAYAQVLDFSVPGSPTVNVGTTSTLTPGSSATVANSGTAYAAVLDFGIPEGPAATINVGTTTTGAPGSSASVVNSGTTSAAVFDFTIPAGAAGVGNPPGAIIAFGGTVLPSDYLWCDGSLVSKTTYAGLYAVLGVDRYGTDTATDFYLPDFRDRFARGANTISGNVGTTNVNSHTHTLNASSAVTTLNATTATFSGTAGNTGSQSANHTHGVNGASTSSTGTHNHNNNGASTGGPNNNFNRATGNAGCAGTTHTHGVNGASTSSTGGHNHNNNGANTGNQSANHTHGFTPSGNVSVTTGTASTTITDGTVNSEDHIPAYVGVNYIIKT